MPRFVAHLVSVGSAAIKDFAFLGIQTVDDRLSCEAEEFYEWLCTITDKKHCISVLDLFELAIAQAKDPDLPYERCQWYYYSNLRKNACD